MNPFRPWFGSIRAAALGTLTAVLACAQPAGPDAAVASNEIFQKAGRAYDAGRYGEAAGLYEQLIARGQGPMEVLFNLANARFREGHASAAVLGYRRAWYLAPRDADIRANLQFALDQTGATLPAVTLPARLLQQGSLREWSWLALAGFWLSAALTCGLWLAARRRALLRGLLICSVAALLLGLAGAGYWAGLLRRPEAVVLQPTQALFAPLANATEHFALLAGALVRIEQQSGDWLQIARGRQTGWIPRARCATVCALQSRSTALNW
ncbi:MAG: hypothetical protein NTV49_06760 [Kiritimatiellaeota bacterium]|nr:hypothetical protein [Kiritimatiellota bacterium]